MARSFLEDIPTASFTDATIVRMYELVDAAKTDEKFQKLIYSVVNHAMPGQWKDYRGELENLLRWVKQNVDYRRDPYNVELVQDVWATLDRKRGDCDDMALLFAAGAEVLGAPARFVTVSTRPNKQPSHVYTEVNVDGQWTSVDPIMQESFVGWEPVDGVTAKRVWSRKSLGLDGYDADEPVEGLGMNSLPYSMPEGWTDDQYNVTSRPGGADRWEGGFADRMFSVNLTPVPNDISATFAPGVPGSEIIMRRRIPGALIYPTSDPVQMERPGGGVYSPEYPIMDREDPSQIFKTILEKDIPMVFNPDIWTGSVPYSEADPNAMLPQKAVTEEAQLVDLAGIGMSPQQLNQLSPEDRQRLHNEYRHCVQEVCAEAKAKIQKCREDAGLSGLGVTYLTYRELEPQAPMTGEYMNTLMGLGAEVQGGFLSDATKIGASIASAVTAGLIPKDKVESALNFAVDYWAQKRGLTTETPRVPPPVYVPPPLPPVAKAGIGGGTLAIGAVVAYLVLSKKSRSRRRRR